MNIFDLSESTVLNMSQIHRFSGTRFVVPESVADHVGECIGILLKLHSLAPIEFDLTPALARMSVHDLGECYTGDVVRPIKYYNEEIKHYFDEAETKLLHEDLIDSDINYISSAKHRGDKLDSLLTFVDVIQAGIKLTREIKIQRTRILVEKLDYTVNCLVNDFLPALHTDYGDSVLYNECKGLVDSLTAFYIKHSKKGALDE